MPSGRPPSASAPKSGSVGGQWVTGAPLRTRGSLLRHPPSKASPGRHARVRLPSWP